MVYISKLGDLVSNYLQWNIVRNLLHLMNWLQVFINFSYRPKFIINSRFVDINFVTLTKKKLHQNSRRRLFVTAVGEFHFDKVRDILCTYGRTWA